MQLAIILVCQVFLPNAFGFVNIPGTRPIISSDTRQGTNSFSNGIVGRRPSKQQQQQQQTTRLFDAPEPLAEEGSWQAFLDEETTGLIYYFDLKTGESLWEPPTATFPEVRLPRKKQRLAENLRKEYRRQRQQEIYGDINDGSTADTSTTTLMEVEEEEEIQQADDGEQMEQEGTQTPEGPSWIEGIFDTGDVAGKKGDEVAESAEDVIDESEPKRDWFSFFDDAKRTEPDVVEEEETEAEPTPPNWFGGFFASSTTTVEEEEEVETEEGNKFGLFDSFASSFAKSDLEDTAVTTPPEKVESKPPQQQKQAPVKKEVKIADTAPQPIKIDIGSHILPHPAKMRWGGEDAVFVKGRTFGVFDGVSGAEKMDGVPLYSRTLANEMKKVVGNDGCSIQDMTTYLTDAASYADGAATGASTAVVASIGDNGFLQALNVGDSYCIVLRDGKVTAKTREISHYWECPYQLSEDSPDRPRDGTKLNVELMNGDVVIMGSDGVFDNVDDDMLLDLVEKSPRKPTVLARRICDLSRKQSIDKNSVTPYAKQAKRRGDPDYKSGLGGKIDDVSCVVVVCK